MTLGPVVTLTVNPALDVSTEVGHVVADRKLRCAGARRDPGGGGINVSRAIKRLGGPTTAVFACGGASGRELAARVEAEGVPGRAVEVGQSTRENLNVLETSTGRQFRFCLPGGPLRESEWERLAEAALEELPASGILVASGSLSPGMPVDFYARLAARAKAAGHRFAIDTSGPALAAALEEGVFLCKPSRHEIEAFAGEPGAEESRLIDLAAGLVTRGACENLVVSLGAAGALWAARSGSGRLSAPVVPVKSSVGAGDSMLGALVWSLSRGEAFEDAVAWGVAAGAAAVMNPGTDLFRVEDVERLRSRSGVPVPV